MNYQQAISFLEGRNIEIFTEDGFHELWQGDKFVGKWPYDESEIIAMADGMKADMEAARAEEEAERQALKSATEGFTKAAVLDSLGNVIGEASAAPKAREIQVKNDHGLRELKISRSARNLDKARFMPEGVLFSAELSGGEVVYTA